MRLFPLNFEHCGGTFLSIDNDRVISLESLEDKNQASESGTQV